MKPLVQWIYHRVGYNDMWDVLSYDFFTLRTFYSVTYHSGMSRAMAPYVADETTLLAVLEVYLSSDANRGYLF